MEHEEIREKVLLLRDGELSASERIAVEEHLKGCPACRELHEAVCRIVPMLFNEPSPPSSEAFVLDVMARIEQEDAAQPVESMVELPFRWWAPAFSVGLAAAVLLAASPRRQEPVTVESIFSARMGLSSVKSQDTRAADLADLLAIPLEGR